MRSTCSPGLPVLAVIVFFGVAPGQNGIGKTVTTPPCHSQVDELIERLEKRVAQLERTVRMQGEILQNLDPAILKPAMLRAGSLECAQNLSQLWVLQKVYATQYGGRQKAMPKETGSAFWLALTKTDPPLIDKSILDVLVCPLSGKMARAGFTSFRGPKSSVSLLRDEDPVGCCEPGNHPDGKINVLLKRGEVKQVGPEDELYKKALEMCVTTP